jgi:hypothetical protein
MKICNQIKTNLLLNIVKTQIPISKQVLMAEYGKQLIGFAGYGGTGKLTKEYLNTLVEDGMLIVKGDVCTITEKAISMDIFPQNIPIHR